MEKKNDLMNNINMNPANNNKKKSHAARNAAIIGGAVLGGAGSAAAAAVYLDSDEVIPEVEVEEDVDVDYDDLEEVDVEQDVDVSYYSGHQNVAGHQEVADPIVEDVNEVALDADGDDPFDADSIDDDMADGLEEAYDIEFIEPGDEDLDIDMIDIESDSLMDFDGAVEEVVGIDFEDDTLDDIIGDDISDFGVDAEIF